MISTINPKQLFIDSLQFWYYNVNQEQRWNESTFFPSMHDPSQLELVKQQEQQMLFIAQHDDTVLFRHHPDDGFLSYLSDHGIKLPNIRVISAGKCLVDHLARGSHIIPYIKTAELLEELQEKSGIQMRNTSPELVKKINNKFFTRRMAQEHGFAVTEGHFCEDEQGLRAAYNHLRSRGFEKCVIKIPYGSSGKGLKIIEDDKAFEIVLKFIARRSENFYLLIEGWHPVKQNINCQLHMDENGPTILGITEQQIDQNGVYMGTNFTPSYDRPTISLYTSEMMRLGHILCNIGYRGICGVDSIIDVDNMLFPIIELNARFTQVTYLLPLICDVFNEYACVASSYVRFESTEKHDFAAVEKQLDEFIPDTSGHVKFIYTFASYELSNMSKTIYRMYVLFCGQDIVSVQSRINQLRSFKLRV